MPDHRGKAGDKDRPLSPKSREDLEARRRADRYRRSLQAIAVRHFEGNYSAWSRAAGLANANSLYNFMSRRSGSLATRTLERLCQAVPGLTLNDLTGEGASLKVDIDILPVRQKAAAGVWLERESALTDELGRVAVPVELGLPCSEAVLVADGHIDEVYAPGTRLGCVPLAALDRPLRHGDRVLVRRTRNGLAELTVREIAEAGEDRQLVYRSRQEGFGAIIRLPWKEATAGGFFKIDGDRVQITSKVTLAVCPER